MGEVYLSQHPRLPRQEALKVLRPELSGDASFRARFTREADLAAALHHPHIVGVHDRGEYNGRLWIAIDYIDGIDAAELIRQRYPAGLPSPLALTVISAVASALDYAHNKNLVHRDVKPANIILGDLDTDEPRVYLPTSASPGLSMAPTASQRPTRPLAPSPTRLQNN
jgi:serine/threonine-protein kinase